MRFVHPSQQTTAAVTTFTDKAGWEHLLVVMKGTFSIPTQGQAQILPPQPLATTDDFVDEPGLSAPWYENDFASSKARCDVIFKAQAHAPHGKAVKHLNVIARVGAMAKAIHVVGNRHWEKDLFLIRHSKPAPFVSIPLHYGRAFGGTFHRKDNTLEIFAANPVGTGYSNYKEHALVHGMPLPNLEIPEHPLHRPDEKYLPLALSPLARNMPPRSLLAGTYDQHWRDNVAPFLPENFDERFFQCAPDDQQIPFPQGGEEVQLVNIMPKHENLCFCLPPLNDMPIRILFRDGTAPEIQAQVDTLFFEPDETRFSVVWRASAPLPRTGLHGVHVVAAGPLCPTWWEAIRHWKLGCSGCEKRIEGQQPPQGCPDLPDFPAIVSPLGAQA